MKLKYIGVVAGALSCSLLLFGCSSGNSGESANEPAQEAQQAQQAVSSQYDVTIDGCVVTQDYEGQPAMVVSYTWTNNSEEATSFLAAISAKAFQNGVELENAILMDAPEGYNSQSSMAEVKPGGTTSAQEAYLLTDQSDVLVECSELFSWDNTLLAEKTFAVA